MKVVADDKIPFLKGVLEPYCDSVVYLPGGKIQPEDVRDADALITRTRTKCNEKLLAGSKVKFIATATIGFDHFDAAYLDAAGISWTNAPGCNSSSVKQYITSALLNLAVEHGISLRGKTLGVVGVGNVGSKVAAAGRALGMNVLLNDPPRAEREAAEQFVSLERIQSESDFVTLHVPLTETGKDRTYHLADADFLRKLKPGAFFINSSRGEVCDNAALKAALRAEVIRGAALDVWENEPDIDLELLRLVDCGSPHVAGYSTDGKANGTAMSVAALCRFFGLKLKDWYPSSIPGPDNREIVIADQGSFEKTLLEAVNISYDIKADCSRLRASPETFEKQRGDYPLRREFFYYVVAAKRGSRLNPEILSALRELGFNLKEA
jgi:erythronate-4-phosphate dehydrogenase